jgi:excisionase family DNA binding protein
MKTQRRLLTTGEVARLCGFSPSAVLQWIHGGKLASYSSPGGQRRIDPTELERFLKEHGMQAPPELTAHMQNRILIVDDDPGVRTALEEMLRRSGLACRVETAENGVAACIRIPQFRPHLIVLDLVMPELSGVDLCRAVRSYAEFKRTKLLVITGQPDSARLQEALDSGADGWLSKPVAFADFIARIRAALGLPSAPAQPLAAPA